MEDLLRKHKIPEIKQRFDCFLMKTDAITNSDKIYKLWLFKTMVKRMRGFTSQCQVSVDMSQL